MTDTAHSATSCSNEEEVLIIAAAVKFYVENQNFNVVAYNLPFKVRFASELFGDETSNRE